VFCLAYPNVIRIHGAQVRKTPANRHDAA